MSFISILYIIYKLQGDVRMKKSYIFIIILFMFLFSVNSYAKDKLGLLIIAHGAPHKEWNEPVLNLEKDVKELISQKKENPFLEIKVALMEFNEPSIYTAVKIFEKKGIESIYALPIFIAPSGHSVCDIPTILGLYKDKKILNQLKEEKIKIVDANIKIFLGPTLNYGNLLKEIMLDRVKELSANINNESLVILAHGDKNYEKIWSDLCREIGSYICGKTGIKYFNYAFVEVGQSFLVDGVPVILKANEKYEKTIVQGLYLSMGVKSMSKKYHEIFKDKNIIFSNKGLLPDKRVSKWIVKRALECVKKEES